MGQLAQDEAGALTAKEHWPGKIYCSISLVTNGVIKPGEFKPKDLYTDEFKDVW